MMKLHKEGKASLIISLILLTTICIGAYWTPSRVFFWITLVTSLSLYGVMINFFRRPLRVFHSEDEDLVIVAPADGTVVVIEPVEESLYAGERRIQISVFMSIFNVHANWYPVNGKIEHVSHHAGRFISAFLPKASLENEHSDIVIRAVNGEKILTRQVAGAMARRIVTYGKQGEDAHINSHLGFIKFGSRVDVFIPVDSQILVKMDQVVVGNQTVIARLQKK